MKNKITLSTQTASLIMIGAVAGLAFSGPTNALAQGNAAAVPPAAQQVLPLQSDAAQVKDSYSYPYKGPVFSDFIATSYRLAPTKPKENFYPWMQDAYVRSRVRYRGLSKITNLNALIAAIHTKYAAAPDATQRTLIEKQTAGFFFKMIKKSIRHFSLDRGFEFYNVVDHDERQCFLQSALLAGMMQRVGMNAGVVMITKSEKGEESNNGHAVALVKLSDGHDVLVDISSHHGPFLRHMGLMVADARTGQYRFVAPQYAKTGGLIDHYAPLNGQGAALKDDQVHGLGVTFIQSQFDYYRGERAPGGFFANVKSPKGLADSERFFTRSITEDPRNPLPTYALGMVELRSGQTAQARSRILAAYGLYQRCGYVPEGPQSALALVHASPEVVSMR